MARNHACEESSQNVAYQRTNFFENCKFVRCSSKIFPLKLQNDVWQPIFDQLLQTVPQA